MKMKIMGGLSKELVNSEEHIGQGIAGEVVALSSIDYVELLRRRSKTYYEYSQEAFERGDYDIAIFMVASCSATRKICNFKDPRLHT